MNQNLRNLLAIALFGVLIALTPLPAHAAPPGWELRNGSWVPIVTPGAGTPDAQVAQMIQNLKDGQFGDIVHDAKEWIKQNPTHPLMPQVLVLQGDAEVARGNKYRSLYSYEAMLANYPTSELYIHVLDREYNIADAFLNGYKRKFLGIHMFGVAADGLELLDRIQDRQRGSPIAERAGIRAADYHFNLGKFPEAVDAYTDFLKRYPYSQYVRKAEVRRAEASLGTFRGALFDFTPLYDARERLAAIDQAYPQTSQQIQSRAVDDRIYQLEGKKELEIARYYYRAGRKHAAAYYYRSVIANWPDTRYAQDARLELVRNLPQEANR